MLGIGPDNKGFVLRKTSEGRSQWQPWWKGIWHGPGERRRCFPPSDMAKQIKTMAPWRDVDLPPLCHLKLAQHRLDVKKINYFFEHQNVTFGT
jgi:hypothetical protein